MEGEEKVASEALGEPLKKSSSLPVVVLQTEIPPPNPRKCDANFAGLLVSRPSLKDLSVDTMRVDEFFCNGSLQILNAYFMEHKAFSKKWMDLQAFVHKVHPLLWQLSLFMNVKLKSLC
jgi:hypothetical protein